MRKQFARSWPLSGGKRGRRRHGERGFTLVEMLVVITIIGLIMGMVGPRVLNYLSESKVKAAKIQIESFASALDLFYLDTGRYPSTARRAWRRWSAARRAIARLERALPEGRRCPHRSVGQSLCLSRARAARCLRHPVLRFGRPGRWHRRRRRHLAGHLTSAKNE